MRAAVALGWLLAGMTAGLASVAVHPRWWPLVLVVAANGLTAYAVPAGWPRVSFAVGWAVVVGYFTYPRPEGDYLVAQNAQGWLLLSFLLVLVLGSLLTVPRRQAR